MKTALVIILTIIVIFLLLRLFIKREIHSLEGELKLLSESKQPQCFNDLTPPLCSPVRGPITLAEINEVKKIATIVDTESDLSVLNYKNPGNPNASPVTRMGAILEAKFISYIGSYNPLTNSYDDSILGTESYKLIFWSKDIYPIAIVYDNFVIFRGTLTGPDALADITYTQQVVKQSGIKIHSGFDRLFTAIQNQIPLPTSGPLFIIGHSLGCALATLLGFYASQASISDIYIFNYAPPRVGNVEFADYMEKNAVVINFINLADIVPTMPPSYLPFGSILYQYTHIGHVFTFNTVAADLISCHSMMTYM